MSDPILRTKWITIYPTFGFKLEYYTCFGDNDTGTMVINLGFPQIFIDTPFKHKPTERYDFEGGEYGFYWFDNAFVICWAKFIKFFEMPWVDTFVDSYVYNKDGTWFNTTKWEDHEKNESNIYTEVYPYSYTLENGTIQNVSATCKLKKHILQPNWCNWLKLDWFKKDNIWIDVMFDKEIGERTGSWKGGTMGCGWDIKPSQTVERALRDMESNRKFN